MTFAQFLQEQTKWVNRFALGFGFALLLIPCFVESGYAYAGLGAAYVALSVSILFSVWFQTEALPAIRENRKLMRRLNDLIAFSVLGAVITIVISGIAAFFFSPATLGRGLLLSGGLLAVSYPAAIITDKNDPMHVVAIAILFMIGTGLILSF